MPHTLPIQPLAELSSAPASRVLEAAREARRRAEAGDHSAPLAADRCVHTVLQHLHARTLGYAESQSGTELVRALVGAGEIPEAVARHVRAVQALGQSLREARLRRVGATGTELQTEQAMSSLGSVLQWYTERAPALPSGPNPEATVVVPDVEVTLEQVIETVEVDRECYGDVGATDVPDPAQIERWYVACSRIWTLLRDAEADRVVGYINAMPVHSWVYERIVSGALDEAALGLEEIRPYLEPGFYDLYFCSIAIREAYRTPGNLRKLVDGFLAKLARLAQRGMYVRRMVADAVTPAGRTLCERFGLEAVGASTRGTEIYRLESMPEAFPAAGPEAAKVARLYEAARRRYGAEQVG